MAAIRKTCAHARGKRGAERMRAWRRCSCAWVGDLYVDGRRRYPSLGPDLGRARAELLRLQAEIAAGRPVTVQAGTGLLGVASRLRGELARAGRKVKTLAELDYRLVHVERWFGDCHPASVTASEIAAWRADLGRARTARTVDLIAGALRQVLAQAQREGLIQVVPEPPRPISARRDPQPAQRLTLAEAEAVIAGLACHVDWAGHGRWQRPACWRAAGELILLTGLRIGELLALTPEVVHADDQQPWLAVVDTRRSSTLTSGSPKTATSRRRLPLSPRAVDVLAGPLAGAAPGEYLWPGAQDGSARLAIHAAYAAAGIVRPARPWHVLRSAAADLMESAGLTIREQAGRLGHGSHFAQTAAYGSLAEQADPGRIDAARQRHGASDWAPPDAAG